MKRAALGSVLLALGILIAGPAPSALAHADLILSTPDDGAGSRSRPHRGRADLQRGPARPRPSSCPSRTPREWSIRVLEYEVDGADVIVTWPPGLSGSDYTVNYRVVSQDGHPVSGSLAFTVDDPAVATGPSASPASVDPEAASAVEAVDSADDRLGRPDGRDRRRPRGRHRRRLPLPGHPSAGPLVGGRRAGRTRTGPRAVTTVQRSTTAGLGTAPIALIAVALGALALVATAVGLVARRRLLRAGAAGSARSGRDRRLGCTRSRRALTDLAAVATVGWLLAATFLDPSGKDGVVSPTGRRDLRRAAIAAAVWAVLALVQLFLELANVLGLPLAEAVSPDHRVDLRQRDPRRRAPCCSWRCSRRSCASARS